MAWVPVPNRHDGDGYTTLVSRKNGAAIYGAWMVILQVASRCDPRGTLLRAPQKPHDAASIARITRLPQSDIQAALDICTKEVEWLEAVDVKSFPQEGAVPPHEDAVIPHDADQEGKGTELNGKNRNEPHDPHGGVAFVFLKDEKFKAAWGEWKKTRMGMGKKPADWKVMFQKQMDWLEQYSPDVATEILNKTMRQGWTGLFPPDQKSTPPIPEPKQIQESIAVKLL